MLDDCSTGHADSVPAGVELVETRHHRRRPSVLAGGGFDAVLHFAAKSLVGESVVKPSLYWRTNVYGTRALLDAITEHAVPTAGVLLHRGHLRRAGDDPDHRGRADPAHQHLRRHQAGGRHDDHR